MIEAHSNSRFAFLGRQVNTCQALFYGLITLYALLSLTTLNHYGIHGDEPGHVRYGLEALSTP
ncbi:MAG: hypothetical protein O7G87_15325 [bacterium]|nr:hypothetical protein [bacterium]